MQIHSPVHLRFVRFSQCKLYFIDIYLKGIPLSYSQEGEKMYSKLPTYLVRENSMILYVKCIVFDEKERKKAKLWNRLQQPQAKRLVR